MVLTLDSQLDVSPDRRAGKPCIVGTRIAVQDIVFWHVRQNRPVAEIARDFELTMSAVHAALAYYYERRERIDAEMAAEEAESDAWIAAAGPSLVRQKLAAMKRV